MIFSSAIRTFYCNFIHNLVFVDNTKIRIFSLSLQRPSGLILEIKGSALYSLKSPIPPKVYTRHRGQLIFCGLPVCAYIRVFGDT